MALSKRLQNSLRNQNMCGAKDLRNVQVQRPPARLDGGAGTLTEKPVYQEESAAIQCPSLCECQGEGGGIYPGVHHDQHRKPNKPLHEANRLLSCELRSACLSPRKPIVVAQMTPLLLYSSTSHPLSQLNS